MKNTKQEERLFHRLLYYSNRYNINFQMWPNQYTIYIEKGDVELGEFMSGFDNAKETIEHAVKYLDRITRNPEAK